MLLPGLKRRDAVFSFWHEVILDLCFALMLDGNGWDLSMF